MYGLCQSPKQGIFNYTNPKKNISRISSLKWISGNMNFHAKPIAILLAFITFSLTGCLATTNLAADDAPISATHRQQAKTMLNLLHTRCILAKQHQGTVERIKIADEGSIKRLFSSDSDWLKAEAAFEGMWRPVYYNEKTGEFICSTSEWKKKKDSSKVRFTEISSEE